MIEEIKKLYEEGLNRLRAKGNATYDDYYELVSDVYMQEGFMDLKPIPLADMRDLSRERWLEIRKNGPDGDIPYIVGGSAVAGILGISKFESPLMAKHKLQGGSLKKEGADNSAIFQRGNDAEGYIAGLINRFDGFEDVEVVDDQTFYQHPVFDFMAGNVDRFLKATDDSMGIAEIKSLMSFDNSTKEAWKEGIVPDYYVTQGMWYMAIMNLQTVDFFCGWGLSQATEMATARVERNVPFEMELVAYVLHFLEEVVKKDAMPDLSNAAGKVILSDLYAITGDNFNKDIRTSVEDDLLMSKVRALDAKKKELKSFTAEKKLEEDQLKAAVEALEGEIALEVEQHLLAEMKKNSLADSDVVQSGGVEVVGQSVKTTVYYNSKATNRFSMKGLEDNMKHYTDFDLELLKEEIAGVQTVKDFLAIIKPLGTSRTTSKPLAIGKFGEVE